MNLQSTMKKVYKKTRMYELDVLLAEESKWKRRQTIADNKVNAVRLKINAISQELARKEAESGTTKES